jgi:hypothetical protein
LKHLLARTWVRSAIALLLVAATAWFAGQRLVDGAFAVDGSTIRDNLPILAAAVGMLALSSLLLGAGWIALLEAVTPESPRRRGCLLVAFSYAWLGRYVPGTLPFFAGRVVLGQRVGYRTRPLVLTTAVQNVLEVLVSVVVGACLLIASLGVTERDGLFVLLAVAPALALLVLHPTILRRVANAALRMIGREDLPEGELPPGRALALSASLVIANQALNGLALWIVLDIVAGASPSDAMLVTGALSLAGAAGMFVVLVPAGLGVRDGALTALLASRFTVEAAALASVMFRLCTVVADLTLFAAAFVVDLAAGWRIALGALRGEGARPVALEPSAPERRVPSLPERRSA